MSDVIVIGGGVMGTSIAWRLAQAQVSTTVLERAIPGAEASSAAAGILAAQEEAEGPGPLAELALASRARFPALADELRAATSVDIAYRPVGLVSLAESADAEARLEARYGWQRQRGRVVKWLRGAELRAVEPGVAAEFEAGLHFPDDHQLDPRPYGRALAIAAERAGVRFHTGAVVRRIVHEGGRVVGVDTDAGRMSAGHVVLAAGSWSSLVEGTGLGHQAVRPMRGQIARLETRPPAVRGTIVGPGGYLVGRADGTVLAGSTMELAGFDKSVTAGGLAHVLGSALKMVPALATAPVVETWANFRPTTGDRLPILGPGQTPGLWLATGHFRNGILLSPITAEIVRDLITTGTASCGVDLEPFGRARLG
jgi:glycine oxidase